MKKMTYLEIQGAETLLSAIPMRRLPGKTVAVLAVALALLSRHIKDFRDALAKAAEGIKCEGYDKKAADREQQIKDLFPEGTPFDDEVWKAKCKDKAFEKIFEKTEKKFQKIYAETAAKQVEVDNMPGQDILADIAEALSDEETVIVGEQKIPFEIFMREIAHIVI